jgi:thioesterase domain-containing protein
VLASSGPHQYARFAARLTDGTPVSAVDLPGFRPGERLPATLDAIVQAVATAIGHRGTDSAFSLVGYSSGGILAHAVASRLESDGVFPEAVVLLDTYLPGDPTPNRLIPALLDGMADRMGDLTPLDDIRLTAMGGYLGLIADWRPSPLKAPVLLVRAEQPVPTADGMSDSGGWQATWPHTHIAIDVAADHFSMIEGQAGETARAVQDWLSTARRRSF